MDLRIASRKTVTRPIFFIDGRYARSLRKLLNMPDGIGDLDENTTTGVQMLPLKTVRQTLGLRGLNYVHHANHRFWLCGGALTGWIGGYPTSDYDFFVKDDHDAQDLFELFIQAGYTYDSYTGDQDDEVVALMEDVGNGYTTIVSAMADIKDRERVRAITLRAPVVDGSPDWIQIVLLIQQPTLVDVISTFDFTICQLGTDGHYLYWLPYTWTDLFRKRLRVHNIHHGYSTMRRMLKYYGRGFWPCQGTMLEVAQGVINSPDTIISLD